MEALREAGFRDQVKIMAGGAPVSDEFVQGSVGMPMPPTRRLPWTRPALLLGH